MLYLNQVTETIRVRLLSLRNHLFILLRAELTMTLTFLATLGRKGLRLSLLLGLCALAACEGSQIGNNLGQSLEPDPQLAAEGTETETTSGDADSDTSDTGSSNASNTENNEKAADEADESEADATEEEATNAQAADSDAVVAGDYTDLGKAPEEIQAYLVDLIELDLLEVRAPATPPTPAPAAESSDDSSDESDTAEDSTPEPVTTPTTPPAPNEFRPNQAMTRREYARWLLAVNNRFYAGERTRKIRPGVNSSQPVFKDVPVTDPDFASIQGLAEAGMIPSPLTGSSTTINFRPDAPLTRKDLLLWKVPLDTRQALPTASVSAVEQAWGFQDAAKIEPRALQAVLADYQNGDFANIRRAFNYTTLFQPDKAATRAEGAAVLWRFGNPAEGITAGEVRNPNSSTSNNNNTEENEPTDG